MALIKRNIETIRNYELQEKLGEGGFGVVYRAYDTHLQRTVVVKLLHRTSANIDNMGRLMDEARLTSAIEHPNICTIYEAGEVDGQPYLVMQYIPGRTLLELIDSGALSEPLALSIGIQVANGLAAAHRLGILHRDLKPANIMVTDEGLAKILDFGLARRTNPEADPSQTADTYGVSMSSRFGTTAYMAPEQFVTRRSSEQSDIWSLGVILYQMATGRHPFWIPSSDVYQLVHAIQFRNPVDPREIRPDLHPGFAEIILKTLVKQPDDRFHFASDIRDALKTLARTIDPSVQWVPGEAGVPAPPAEDGAPRGGLFSMLADRFFPTRAAHLPKNAVAILPFQDYGSEPSPPFYGFAMAEAVATRLAQVPALLVRPPRMIQSSRQLPADPIEAGRQMAAAYVLTGQFSGTVSGFHVNWKLLAVETDAVLTGQAVEFPSTDFVTMQVRLGEEVFAALQAADVLPITTTPQLLSSEAVRDASIPTEVAEKYLNARALLNSQITRSSHQEDLEQARRIFETVIAAAPDFAPAHASLGLALTRYVRYGFGGVTDLIAAQRHLDRALELDSSNIEAKLYRAYILLWRGEKEQARRDVQYLLQTAAYDAEVHIVTGVILQLDGLLDEALQAFSTALRIHPTLGPRIYNFRARIYNYQLRMDQALQEIRKGLSLEPRHTLLRTTHAVWFQRRGELDEAISLLEGVIADDPNLRLAYPCLAIAYHRSGQPDRAAALMDDQMLAMGAADCEMAYRIATYFAVAQNVPEALHWLRKAVYLGNHNAPWFNDNPDWATVRDNPEIRQTLEELTQTQRGHHERWRRVLGNAAG